MHKIDVPPLVTEVGYAFYEAGYQVYLVGGYVRDKLLGEDPVDVDLCTDATPTQIKTVLNGLPQRNRHAIFSIGEKYGTIGMQFGQLDLEVTTYRTDQYADGSRHPEVQFGNTVEEDLERRDFTMNALLACPFTGRIIDYVGGMEDITTGTIRAVGNPGMRIVEDPLRMLRAVRLGAQLGFVVDLELYEAIKDHAESILDISWERIRDEVTKMMLGPRPAWALTGLQRSGLLYYVLPEVDDLVGVQQIGAHHYVDAFDHTLDVVRTTPPELWVRFGALLHDTGKAETAVYDYEKGKTTFYGHEEVSGRLAHKAMSRLRFPTKDVEAVTHLCGLHMNPNALLRKITQGETVSRKSIRKLMRKAYKRLTPEEDININELMTLNGADVLAHTDPDLDAYNTLWEMIEREYEESVIVPEDMTSPLDGHEIMAALGNERPGPWIARTKEHLTNLVVEGTIEVGDKEAAVQAARKYWNV